MCGLVAVRLAREITRDRLDASVLALAPRGPDGRNVALFDEARVALGHTRLAIVDVATGAQPIQNEDGTIACVVSGELYGDEAIRADLEARGHRFRTRSDSEIVVHLYEEHGDAFVEHLRGEFALAIWDGRRKRLVCARDRFGVRPLVYARVDDGVVIASEVKALFAFGVRPRWDSHAMWLSACAQYTPPDRTVFEGCRQVPPGFLLVADDRGVHVSRYWDFDLPRAEEKRAKTTSAEALRATLEEAIAIRLRAESASVACTLSGGLDSSSVAAIASRIRPIEAFTLAFAEDAYDESAIAARTAKDLGIELHTLRVTPRSLWDALPAAVAQSEGLSINFHVAAKWLLAREVSRRGHRVLLTGEGADELLAGYAHFRRDVLIEHDGSTEDLGAKNSVSAGLMMPDGETLDVRAVARALGFVPSFIEAKAALGKRVSGLLSPDFAHTFSDRDPWEETIASLDGEQLRGRERVDQSSYAWCKLALAGYILRTLGDGTEAGHAVEGRVPFLDHHLFEVTKAIPTAEKIRGEVDKHVLRAAMKDVLSEEVIARRKHPLLAPPSVTAIPEARELLTSSALPPMFDRLAVALALDHASRERTTWEPPLMMVLTATLLARHYGLES